MSEVGKKNFHFNVNVRSSSGSKAQMSNNEDNFLRAMEIQERKRAKIEEELEKQRIKEEAENPVAPAPEENPIVESEEVQVEEPASEVAEAPAAQAEPAVAKSSGPHVPGPTPRSDFTSEEKEAMRKRAKAHAVVVKARKK